MDKKSSNNAARFIYIVLAVVFIGILMFQFTNMRAGQITQLSTSEFVTAVNDGRVSEVSWNISSDTIAGKYRESGTTDTAEYKDFTSTYVGEESLNQLMAAHSEIKYTVDTTSNSVWLTILTTILPLIIIVAVFWFFMSQMQGANSKQMQFGKTKAKIHSLFLL